ncbi:MAG: hypothetical protein U1E46_04320 [Hyphomicrobiales bacterium]|jgi:hypothetical protein
MARGHYEPPKQGWAGQLIDVLTLLVLTVGALYLPLYMGLAGGGKVTTEMTDPTWEKLQQNEAMQHAWTQLGLDPAGAAAIINSRFDYSFSLFELIVLVVVVLGYFLLVVNLSGKEYRDVIAERFDNRR